MTQNARVLRMLKDAGPKGVRSDQGYKEFIPRMAARIKDLRDEGHNITSEREGKFCRYTLQDDAGKGGEGERRPSGSSVLSGVGVGAENGGRDTALDVDRPAQPHPRLSVDPGESSPEVHTTGSAPLPGPAVEAQASGEVAPSLFDFTERPLSAFTDQEAA